MNRFKQIDILRALAVILVLVRHLVPCPAETSPWLHQFILKCEQGGWVGVDLFFVLSGFLVSGLLFREYEKHHDLHVGRFLIRRGFKIYPSFWLLIGMTAILVRFTDFKVSPDRFVTELLFLQNYRWQVWGHTWSLATEEHFYLLLALGFFLLARGRSTRPFRLIPAAFGCVAVLCLALRLFEAALYPFEYHVHMFPSHLRMDSLAFGVLLSYLFHQEPFKFTAFALRFRHLLLVAGVLLLTPAFCFTMELTPFIYTYGFTLFYLGSGCLLVSALGFQMPANRAARGLAYLGSHSYSVYLWHLPLGERGTAFVMPLFGQHFNWFVYAVYYLAGSVIFGVAMSLLVEFPLLRIRDRFFPSRGNPLSTDATGPGNSLPSATPT